MSHGNPDLATRLQLFEDRQAVYELEIRYAHLVDCGRYERLAAEIFTADALLDYGTGLVQGRDAINAFYGGFAGGIVGTSHNLTNFFIEVNGDAARCMCRAMAWHWLASADGSSELHSADILAIGGYQDDLRRESGGWRISNRRAVQFGSGIGVGTPPAAIRQIFEGMLGRLPTWPA